MTNLAERLIEAVSKQRKQITVIGDTMVDRWVHGKLAECQDGCQKFVQIEVVETPGGAANAERCLSKWRAMTNLYGFTDNYCPVKTRYIQDGCIVLRIDDDGPPLRGLGYDWARDLALEMVAFTDAVLISDYDKGFLVSGFIREIATICNRRGIPCVADCKREAEVYDGCILKRNADWQWKYKLNLLTPNAVLTNGALPPCVEGRIVCDDLADVKCVNHVGAGDCFAAHLTLALAYGFSLKEAAALAHSAGRVYVQHPHNRPPHPEEIAADMATAELGLAAL